MYILHLYKADAKRQCRGWLQSNFLRHNINSQQEIFERTNGSRPAKLPVNR
ncbi:MAG: hypothetical protein ABIN13_06725 [Mucilaginibacter sp.]